MGKQTKPEKAVAEVNMSSNEQPIGKAEAGRVLERLNTQLLEGDYQPIEHARLARDLERVEQRLIKGEYFYTDFAGNTFNVPERTREYFIYFNSYFKAARTWARVLEKIDVHRFSEVADLCPGWAPKLELALFYLQYKGKLVLLDKDASSLEQNQSFIRLFNPQYEVRSLVTDIFDLKESPGELVLANHLIDDLLLNLCAAEAGFDPLAIYEREESMKNAWDLILGRRRYFFSKIVDELAQLFLRLVPKGGCLILTQYQAYVEKLLDLQQAAAFCKEVALGVVERLKNAGFSDDPSLVRTSLAGISGWFEADECFLLER
jgi:hypothetical protein